MICKITKKKLKPFMTFGKMPIANGFIKKKYFKKEYFFEMEVGFSRIIINGLKKIMEKIWKKLLKLDQTMDLF